MRKNNLSRIDKLVELYYLPLFRFAKRLCGNPVEAMVLTQRTFRRAFDSSHDLPETINNRAWLFAILFNGFLEGRLPGHAAYAEVPIFAPERSEALRQAQ